MSIFDLFRRIEGEKAPESGETAKIEWIFACLGNPGDAYTRTRHNMGFLVADTLAERQSVRLNRLRFRSLTCEIVLSGKRILLMKPQTYMNLSGEAVREAIGYYRTDPSHLIVFCDDVALAPGNIRVREKGSAGGHNGLKNIIENLSTEDFCRVRIGVGEKADPHMDLGDWVLGKIPENDMPLFRSAVDMAIEAAALLVEGKAETAKNRFNVRQTKKTEGEA